MKRFVDVDASHCRDLIKWMQARSGPNLVLGYYPRFDAFRVYLVGHHNGWERIVSFQKIPSVRRRTRIVDALHEHRAMTFFGVFRPCALVKTTEINTFDSSCRPCDLGLHLDRRSKVCARKGPCLILGSCQ